MKHIAIIPVKEKSDRVLSKNFRLFSDTKSILELKIQQVLASNVYARVIVSSDSLMAKELANKYGVEFHQRDKRFCNNDVPWSEVIETVVGEVSKEDEVVSWCHTTSPLFEDFATAVKLYSLKLTEGYDGLATVTKFNEFLVTEKGRPYNYSWGIWHEYSQDLEPLFKITGALFITSRENMLNNKYVISKKPYWYETSAYCGLDIDTDFDFKLAQLLFENKGNFHGS